MIKGGYKIIDLKGLDILTDGGITIKGIFNAIEESYQKPILLSGINIDGVEKNDVYVIPEISGTDYVVKCYGYVLTIDDDDEITAGTELIIPALPSDASTKTYALQSVLGELTWVEVTE